MNYTKPACYEELNNKPLTRDEIIKRKKEIELVCIYRAQDYVYKHINTSSLQSGDIEDILHEVLMMICVELNNYFACEENVSTEYFWGCVHNWIKYDTIKAYHKYHKENFGASSSVQKKAKKMYEEMMDNNMSFEEMSEKTGHKVSTLQNYSVLSGTVNSLDKEDELGLSGYEKINSKDDMTLECNYENIDDVYRMLEQNLTKEEAYITKKYINIRYKDSKRAWKKELLEECKHGGFTNKRTMEVVSKVKTMIATLSISCA